MSDPAAAFRGPLLFTIFNFKARTAPRWTPGGGVPPEPGKHLIRLVKRDPFLPPVPGSKLAHGFSFSTGDTSRLPNFWFPSKSFQTPSAIPSEATSRLSNRNVHLFESSFGGEKLLPCRWFSGNEPSCPRVWKSPKVSPKVSPKFASPPSYARRASSLDKILYASLISRNRTDAILSGSCGFLSG